MIGIRSDTIANVSAHEIVRRVRRDSHLSLRELAERASTSHSTISAYEAERIEPSMAVVERLVRAAGFAMTNETSLRIRGSRPEERGDELAQVLELAAMFPARHSKTLTFPRFGLRR